MKVLVNPTGWEMTAEAAEEPTPEATGAVVKSSGVYAKTREPDRSPESFSPTEPAPASDDPLDNEVTLPPPPSLPRDIFASHPDGREGSLDGSSD
jgi:hypothetical protein